jgi:hypothetical protein
MRNRKLLLLLPVLLLAGCISAATIASYLPIFETAVNGVIALVKPAASPAIQADEAKVNVAVTDLVAAINNIQGSTTVSAALSDVESAATQLESDLGVSTNKDVQLATAILDLAIGTYQAIIQAHMQSLPKSAMNAEPVLWASYPPQVKAGMRVRPAAKSVGDFKRQFNKLVKDGGHPEMQMKLSMGEKLHVR